jgi:aspartokinase-like uncharacterized kinase
LRKKNKKLYRKKLKKIKKNLKNFEKKIYKIPGGWVDGWVGKS